jgi:alkyldihydroxyacetonephosphate synthase
MGFTVAERPVRDLWPLELMQRRAGAPPPVVTVASPTTYEQVGDLLRWAAAHQVVVVPMGAATGVCGAVAPEPGQVVLDLRPFDRLTVDRANLTVTAGAGIVGLALEQHLYGAGLTLGHQPSSLPVSTIGGLVSTRSSGQESTRYGSIEDMLLGATVALPDGTIASAGHGPRSAVGPALHQLLVGAEGALGVVLEVRLKVHRIPPAIVGRGYRFDGLEAGLEAMRAIMQADLRPLVLRLYDEADTAFQGVTDGGCLLVTAAAGEPEMAQATSAVIARLCAGAADLGEAPFERWRNHRYSLSAERLTEALEPPGAFVDTIEVAASWTDLPALYHGIRDDLAERGLVLCHFSHAYAQGGCAYFTFAGSASDEAAAQAAYEANWADAMKRCLATPSATISHHHGVGRARGPWARQELGGWWPVWQAIRRAVDPDAVLNPNAFGGWDQPT